MKPEQRVVLLQHRTQLLQASPVGRAANNAGLNENIGSGNGDARSRQYNDGWDDWDE